MTESTESIQMDIVDMELVQAEPTQIELIETESMQVEPMEMDPTELESIQAEPLDLESVQTMPPEMESTQMESTQTESLQTEPSQSFLTPDIIHLLVDKIDDVEGLKALTLTNKSLGAIAQRALFRRVATLNLKNYSAFERLVATKPWLTEWMRRLKINDYHEVHNVDYLIKELQSIERMALPHTEQYYLYRDVELGHRRTFLSSFQNAVKLCHGITDVDIGITPLNASDIESLCSLPNLKTLKLNHIQFGSLATVWNASPHLKHVEVKHFITEGPHEQFKPLVPREVHRLELSVDKYLRPEDLKALLQSCSGLKRLHLFSSIAEVRFDVAALRLAMIQGLTGKWLETLDLTGSIFVENAIMADIRMDLQRVCHIEPQRNVNVGRLRIFTNTSQNGAVHGFELTVIGGAVAEQMLV